MTTHRQKLIALNTEYYEAYKAKLPKPKDEDTYDLVVIGGGSGGLGCARAASKMGKRVLLTDYVEPSPGKKVTWGLGGTCVNVGCIPKKLFHHAALLAESIDKDSQAFGIEGTQPQTPLQFGKTYKFSWDKMISQLQNHIISINSLYLDALTEEKILYVRGKGEFETDQLLVTTTKEGQKYRCKASYFVVAIGARPIYPDNCPGAYEYGITSDDLFSLDYPPGKTLVVGSSYVAMECAGFLSGLGYPVEVLVRDERTMTKFDKDMARLVTQYMEEQEKIKFHYNVEPIKIEKIKDGKPGELKVTWQRTKSSGNASKASKSKSKASSAGASSAGASSADASQASFSDTFNTVLFAIGRRPPTESLKLDRAGVNYDKKTGYIPCKNEQTNKPNIFAVGDCVMGVPQLTPTAVRAGQYLASRLFEKKDYKMDYVNVPRAVYTPLEYSYVGYSEEEAITKFGADAVTVYQYRFTPYEFFVPHKEFGTRPEQCGCAKVVCRKDPKQETLIGFHYLGPQGSDIVQLATPLLTKGASHKLLVFDTIGVHPSCSEMFSKLRIPKQNGQEHSYRCWRD